MICWSAWTGLRVSKGKEPALRAVRGGSQPQSSGRREREKVGPRARVRCRREDMANMCHGTKCNAILLPIINNLNLIMRKENKTIDV